MTDAAHRLHLRTYAGSKSSFHVAECGCGWMSADQTDPEMAEGEWRDHLEGRVPPWLMAPGERRDWRAGRTTAADLPEPGN